MLTLEEIKNVTFHKARNGYQTEDVDDFIDSVIETVDSILSERDDYLKKLDIFAKKVEEYRASEESVGSVLLSAQRLADANIKEATHKAEVILKDAQAKADAMLSEAKAKSDAMLADAKQQSDKIITDASGSSKRAIAAGNLELERQKELLKKINADVKAFQALLLKRYRAQITAVKNITDIQAQIRTDAEIDQQYPTTKKEEPVPAASPSSDAAVPQAEQRPTVTIASAKAVPTASAPVSETKQEPAEINHTNIIEDISSSSSSSVTREPLTSKGSRFAEDSEVKFNDFKFGSDFDIHSKN